MPRPSWAQATGRGAGARSCLAVLEQGVNLAHLDDRLLEEGLLPVGHQPDVQAPALRKTHDVLRGVAVDLAQLVRGPEDVPTRPLGLDGLKEGDEVSVEWWPPRRRRSLGRSHATSGSSALGANAHSGPTRATIASD